MGLLVHLSEVDLQASETLLFDKVNSELAAASERHVQVPIFTGILIKIYVDMTILTGCFGLSCKVKTMHVILLKSLGCSRKASA